jgi:c-di-GMP-binding flagellar brake protein YcgR
MALRLVGPDSRAMRDFDGARGAVESIGPDGIHRIHGTVEQPGGPSASALRFVLRSAPQLLGRRQHIRAALRAPVVLTVERTGEKLRGRSENVSEGGMLMEGFGGSSLPELGARVRFALAPRNSREAITGSGEVTRVDAARGLIAIGFGPLPRETADELARVVFEQHQGGRSARR